MFATSRTETTALRAAFSAAIFDPEGVIFHSPGCSAAEPWVRGRIRMVSPNGATFPESTMLEFRNARCGPPECRPFRATTAYRVLEPRVAPWAME
jgi:hypothetical protein